MSPTIKNIEKALREVDFPKETRRSVRKNEEDPKKGFALGLVWNYSKGPMMSRMTKKLPELAILLNSYIDYIEPDFQYTTIQVNRGGSGLHVDSLNCGDSRIVSCGSHTGGDLWTLESPNPLRIKGKLRRINGNIPHVTLPYTGERFSLVYFTLQGKSVTGIYASLLKKIGFNLPKTQVKKESIPLSYYAFKDFAAKVFKAEGRDVSVLGDYNNKNIKSSSNMYKR